MQSNRRKSVSNAHLFHAIFTLCPEKNVLETWRSFCDADYFPCVICSHLFAIFVSNFTASQLSWVRKAWRTERWRRRQFVMIPFWK